MLTKDDPLSEELLQQLYQKVYHNYIKHIDGIDNGINSFDDGNKVYTITSSLRYILIIYNISLIYLFIYIY